MRSLREREVVGSNPIFPTIYLKLPPKFCPNQGKMEGVLFMLDNTLKYNRVEKLKIAKEHVDDGLSYDELSKKYDLSI